MPTEEVGILISELVGSIVDNGDTALVGGGQPGRTDEPFLEMSNP